MSQFNTHLLGYPCSNTHGCHSTRLRTSNLQFQKLP
jgi:hypothetical protein